MELDMLVGRFEEFFGHKDLSRLDFVEDEYTYKFERGRMMREWLAEGSLRQLVEHGKAHEVCRLVGKSFQMSGPLARWDECLWPRDLDKELASSFASSIIDFLYGSEPFLDRFDRFIATAGPIYGEARANSPSFRSKYKRAGLSWPFVSYFHFLMWPDQNHVFVKPTPLQAAAELADFNIEYDSDPNRNTYERVRAFYEALWPTVKSLGGRDWIDVQTFIHVIGEGFENGGASVSQSSGGSIALPLEQLSLPEAAPELESDLEAIVQRVQTELIFDREAIVNYHLSLRTRRFAILTGLSGTGKTALTRAYADAVHRIVPKALNPYYEIVAVHPDWTDTRALLGYHNPLTESYSVTRTLGFMLKASRDPKNAYFLCLDEMNLARVEYYFADFLSAMESGAEVTLHTRPDLTDGVPASMKMPSNLFVTGTVNTDETTHLMSDKVLDRANSIDLSAVNLEAFVAGFKKQRQIHAPTIDRAFDLLKELHEDLVPHRLQFGYRTLQEVFGYLVLNEELPEGLRLSFESAMDKQLMQKVLPKVRGDQRIEECLTNLVGSVEQHLSSENLASVRKLKTMQTDLTEFGSTEFWR